MVAFGVRRVYMHKLGVSGYLAFHVLRTRARNRAQYNDLRHKKQNKATIRTHRLMNPNESVPQPSRLIRTTKKKKKGKGKAQVLGDMPVYTMCLKRR